MCHIEMSYISNKNLSISFLKQSITIKYFKNFFYLFFIIGRTFI